MISLILFLAAFLAASIHLLWRRKTRAPTRVVELFLNYMIPLSIGVMSFIMFVGQVFYGNEVATMIGWQPHPAFQFEIGTAYLGFAVVGLMAIWHKRGFWLATVLANTIFLLGCGWIQLTQIMQGASITWEGLVFLYVHSIVIPVILMVLTLTYAAKNHFFHEKAKS